MPPTSNSLAPARRPRLRRLPAALLLALLCHAPAAADTVTMQDAKGARGKGREAADKVRERVVERIAEGALSGVECVDPGLELPVRKEVLAPAALAAVTTIFVINPDPDPEPDPSGPDPGAPAAVPEPASLALLAAGLAGAGLRLGRRARRRRY